MDRKQSCLTIVLLVTMAAAGSGGTVDWKGVTWNITDSPDGNIVTNVDGSVTLTADGDGDVVLQVTDLPGFDGLQHPWVEVSWWDTGNPSHLIDCYTYSSSPSNPSVGVGSLWMATKVGATRVDTNGVDVRGEEYAEFSSYPGSDRSNVQHTAYFEKALDGTVTFQFDSDAAVQSTFVKHYIGGDWDLGNLELRLRGASVDESATFTDFRFLQVATWTGDSGDWTNTANWDTGEVPGDGTAVVVPAGAGTITLDTSTSNLWSYTQAGGTLVFSNWTTQLRATDITVSGGKLTHAQNSDTQSPYIPDARVRVQCSNLTVAADAAINVDFRGYQGGIMTDGHGPGGGKANTFSGGGGAYGGAGGYISGRGAGGAAYGSATAPDEPGSGGGGKFAAATRLPGHGGGLVQIVADGTVTVAGTITANGQINSGGNDTGAGSGGGIHISCHTLTGSGTIRANGERSTYGGGGGGGRIALSYSSDVDWTGSVQTDGAVSGGGGTEAELGTVSAPDIRFLPSTISGDKYRLLGPTAWNPTNASLSNAEIAFVEDGFQLRVTNALTLSSSKLWIPYEAQDGVDTPLLTVGGNATLTDSFLTIRSGNVATNMTGAVVQVTGDLTLSGTSGLYPYSHPTNGASPRIWAANVAIAAGSGIRADGAGFAGGADRDGHGPGGGFESSSSGGGGGYGGHGGQRDTRGLGGPTYGSSNAPALPGSGGGGKNGNATLTAGRAGGLVWMDIEQTVTLNGAITADGADNASTDTGGGSGGGVYLQCRTLQGAGTVTARGGNAGSSAGAGGGGRIAIQRMFDTSTVSASAPYGTGPTTQNNLETGTVVWVSVPVDTPIAENRPASDIASWSATLNGYVFSTGGSPVTVSVYWGDNDGGSVTSGLWDATNAWPHGAWTVGDTPGTNVTLPATDLFYYYRFAVSNAAMLNGTTSSVHFLGGDVWVTAPAPNADEDGFVPGTFTVHRASTATAEVSTVHFRMDGTAGDGVGQDYVLDATNNVTLAKGVSEHHVTLTPLADLDDTEGSETAVLVITQGVYEIGTPASNTVTIADDALAPPGANDSIAAGSWESSLNWSLGRSPMAGDDVTVTHDLTLSSEPGALSSLSVSNAALSFQGSNTLIRATHVTVENGGVLTHAVNSDTSSPYTLDARVAIVCTSLVVKAGGSIDVDEKGYQGGAGTDGHGPGGGKASSSGGGGSYGGSGSAIPGRGAAGSTYGTGSAPDEPGSGGGGRSGLPDRLPGNGGGLVQILASGDVTIDGTISADGEPGDGVNDIGGGSGGGIDIVCHDLIGGGLIQAIGGNANYGGAGGGGRVALRYANSTTWSGSLSLRGGTGGGAGEAQVGTLSIPDETLLSATMVGEAYRLLGIAAWSPSHLALTNTVLGFEQPGAQLSIASDVSLSNSELTLGEPDQDSLLTPALTVGGDMAISGSAFHLYGANVPTNQSGGTWAVSGAVSVDGSSTVTVYSHPTNGGFPTLNMGALSVEAGSLLSADGNGYAGGRDRNGYGPGGGFESGSGGGGGYGGHGGQYTGRGLGGPAYGSSNAPAHPGSGGGGRNGTTTLVGGDGGGMLKLHVGGTLVVDGIVSANGVNSAHQDVGGGAGGGINIHCVALDGGGTIRANGGAAGAFSGAGGGGRIAIFRASHRFTGTTEALKGTGTNQAGLEDGTVVWLSPPDGTTIMIR